MHSGPTHNRDSVDDWQQEVEECLRFMDEVSPDLATYVAWLEAKGVDSQLPASPDTSLDIGI